MAARTAAHPRPLTRSRTRRFNPGHVCNTSDDRGRYKYSAQPSVCRWNLEQFARALAPIIDSDALVQRLPACFDEQYDAALRTGTRAKLGLSAVDEGEADDELAQQLWDTMAATGADMCAVFRLLPLVGLWEGGAPDARGDGDDVRASRIVAAAPPHTPPHPRLQPLAEAFTAFCPPFEVFLQLREPKYPYAQLQRLVRQSRRCGAGRRRPPSRRDRRRSRSPRTSLRCCCTST